MSEGKCIDVPVSWLRLERYHAGELAESERARVAAHLASCASCASCSAGIERDAARPLPPLPVVRSVPPARPLATRAGVAVFAAAALAAGLAFWARRATEGDEEVAVRTKGDAVAFALAREDEAPIVEAGGAYADGERFKVLVSCPPGLDASWDLVVFEHGEASFPLSPESALACGNAVPIPGAFRLVGREPMEVCLLWSDEPIDRDAVVMARRRGDGVVGVNVSCKELRSSP